MMPKRLSRARRSAQTNTKKKIGTIGYCMGVDCYAYRSGSIPNAVGAGGTFHGGGLVTQSLIVPIWLIPKMKAQFLICIAENDDQKEPRLRMC